MTSLFLPVWAVFRWFVQHSSGLYCIVLHLYSRYQTFISLSSYAGYYWQNVHCTMHQTHTGKLLLATVLDYYCCLLQQSVCSTHDLYLLLCMGLGLKIGKDTLGFHTLSTPVLYWNDSENGIGCDKNLIHLTLCFID